MLSRQRKEYRGSPDIQSELMESVSHYLCRNAHSSSVPELVIQGRSVRKPLTSRLSQQKTALTVDLRHVCAMDLRGLDDESTFGISHSVTHYESQQHDVVRRRF